MIWFILIAVGLFLAFKFGSTSGQTVERVQSEGGMSVKYAKLVEHILGDHSGSQVFTESRTYLKAGVSNYAGSTFFHLQQSGDMLLVEYEVKDNPVYPYINMKWSFPDSMDQNEMMIKMCTDIQKKRMQFR